MNDVENKRGILVTGGCGFIGHHLVARLAALGHTVMVIDNLTGKEPRVPGIEYKSLFMDVRDPLLATVIPKGTDTIFHLAALISVPESIHKPLLYEDNNAGGTIGVLEAARLCGIRKVVVASSAAVYTPTSPYALSKAHAEGYCRLYAETRGLDTTCLRIFNAYGEDQHSDAVIPLFVHALKTNQRPVIYGSGAQERDFVFIDDIVDALIAAMDYDSLCMDVGTGQGTSVDELWTIIKNLTGTALEPVYQPTRDGDVYSCIARNGAYKTKWTLIRGLTRLLKHEELIR